MPGAELLLVTLTRRAPDERAETEPANSSVAPLATMAETPVPIVGVPATTLNFKMPPAIESMLPLLRVGGVVISIVPLPALAKLLLPLLTNPPAKVAVAFTVLKVPFMLLVTSPVKMALFWATVIVLPPSLVTGP